MSDPIDLATSTAFGCLLGGQIVATVTFYGYHPTWGLATAAWVGGAIILVVAATWGRSQ